MWENVTIMPLLLINKGNLISFHFFFFFCITRKTFVLLNCFLACNIVILLYEFGSYWFLNRHIFLSFLSHSNFHNYVHFDTDCSFKGKKIHSYCTNCAIPGFHSCNYTSSSTSFVSCIQLDCKLFKAGHSDNFTLLRCQFAFIQLYK